jgi:hypothetical protein
MDELSLCGYFSCHQMMQNRRILNPKGLLDRISRHPREESRALADITLLIRVGPAISASLP